MPARGPAKISRRMVSATPTTANSRIVVPMALPASSGFFSPMCCPMVTVVPMARLVMMRVTICMKELPVPTAEMLAASPNQPTTSRSTAP